MNKQSIQSEWSRMAMWTILGPLACVAVALAYNGAVFGADDASVRERAMAAAVIVPLLSGIPFFLYFSLKLRELAGANRKLATLAATDGLTSCLNRSAFNALVEMRIESLLGDKVAPHGALLIIDIDHFKQVNDRFGHHNGDIALATVAKAIRSSVRGGDSVGRLGGEEFGVFLPGIDRHGAQTVAERLRKTVESAALAANGHSYSLSVSVGGVVFDGTAQFDQLFQQADEHLYAAKREGRNRVRLGGFISQMQREPIPDPA